MYSIGVRQEDLDKLQQATPNEKGFRNLTLKKSKKGSWYIEIYQWEFKKYDKQEENSVDEDLPF